ncbi:MAG: response regulator [Planctomycetes bacterium]|nr:response regulator [Planctomycetota bacterium]
MKVLIVDDSKVMRAMIKRALDSSSLEVETIEAGDGAEALTKVAEGPNLILCDWNMPNMNGVEFVRALRELPNDTPVLMVTTETHFSKKQEATNAGANGFLAKPFTPEQLAEQIQAVVG